MHILQFDPRDWKLGKKLIIFSILLVLLPVISLSAFYLRQANISMNERVESSFFNSVYQMGINLDRHFEMYNTAISFMALNRQVASVFEDDGCSYYQQYYNMTSVIDSLLLVIRQFSPNMQDVGFYTENTHLKERNQAVLYVSGLGQEFSDKLAGCSGVFWTQKDGMFWGMCEVMKLSIHTPDSFAYIKVDPEEILSDSLDNSGACGIYLTDGETTIFSRYQDIAVLDVQTLTDGMIRIDGKNYLAAHYDIEATGWRLWVYYPSKALGISPGETWYLALILGIVSLIFLFIVGHFITSSICGRLNKLNDTMADVTRGRLDVTVQTDDKDEIGELTRHFAYMLDFLNQHIQTNYQNRILLQEAELRALQSQINPHFLYNSLSLINWMAIDCDAFQISEITCSLSDFYRSVLNHGDTATTLREEFENIDAYLKIQSYMHDYSFEIVKDVDESLLSCKILGVILQPLVENAIEHGIDLRPEKNGAKLIICGIRAGNDILLSIIDNGPGMSEDQFNESIKRSSPTYGLKNVQNRIKIAYGEGYGIALRTDVSSGTCIDIRIPFQPDNDISGS